MAAKIIKENQRDQDLLKYKHMLENLNRTAQAFITGFRQMPPYERAEQLLLIQSQIKDIQKFVSLPQAKLAMSAGTRFSFETLKASFSSFLSRWHKFERSLGVST